MNTWYSIKAAADNAPAEVSIFDEIGGYGVSAASFQRALAALPGKTVTLLINSPGGSVVEGLAIVNTLSHSGKTVNGKVMGMAGSMASVIACACQTLTMPANTFMFLHDPIGDMAGDADEHRALADSLDKFGEALVSTYVAKSRQSPAKIRELLKADSLLSANECLALRLCDKVTADLPGGPSAAAAMTKRQRADAVALAGARMLAPHPLPTGRAPADIARGYWAGRGVAAPSQTTIEVTR